MAKFFGNLHLVLLTGLVLAIVVIVAFAGWTGENAEAVTNAVKHAGARSICVDLVRAGERLILTVEDDGVGIPQSLSRGGIGLQTMAHRARMIGASLSVERSAGGGTVVTCSLTNPAPAQPTAAAAPMPANTERAHV